MMLTLVDGLFVLGTGVSVALCALGIDTYRRWDEPGAGAFAVFLALLGLGGIAGGVLSLVLGPETEQAVLWPAPALLALFVGFVPWGLFGLQYTGRYTRLRWRTIGLLVTPYLLTVLAIAVEGGTDVDLTVVGSLVALVLFIYTFSLAGLGIGLVLKTAWEYSHIPFGSGVTIVVAVLVHLVVLVEGDGGYTIEAAAGLYVVAYAVLVGAFAVALFNYGTFESTPAVGTIGEREIARELDDLVFVVDDSGRIVTCNESVVETLGVSREELLSEQLTRVTNHDPEALGEHDTVTLETVDGARRYDTQVSPVTDQHGRELGSLVSLHDVTERELREQRLAVLNRVLRHNLRNDVTVIKSHAEVLAEENGKHADTIVDRADHIVKLGQSARTIDRFVSNSTSASEVDLGEALEKVLSGIDDGDVTVSVDLPDSATVETNHEALAGALESAIDNAVSYTDSTVEISVAEGESGYAVTITDDGPGVPDSELESLNAETETPLQHGTGLGLWQLKWAVTTMGGDLEFDTTDGTTVTFTVPNQGVERIDRSTNA